MDFFKNNIHGDRVIWVAVLILTLLSTLVVYSATSALAAKYQGGNTEYYLLKHVFTLAFGLLLMLGTHKIKFHLFSRFSQIAFFLAIPLLIYTLIKGADVNSASRWIKLPVINLTFQTSDFAKLAIIAFTARQLSKKQHILNNLKEGFFQIIWPILLICVLIVPANFSTAAVLFTTCFTIMFCGRVSIKYLFSLILIGITGFSFLLLIGNFYPKLVPRAGTWVKRIETFSKKDTLNSDGSYQPDKAKMAIASGGVIGRGPGKSIQRNYLPEASSDFIYAIIIEEYGSTFGFFIVLLYLIILFRGLRISNKCNNTFGSLLSYGLCFGLVFQAMVNMAVAVNLFPVTGQPLPMLSMGGTSIWFTSISLGIILSVSRELEKEEKTEENKNSGSEDLSYA
jgi:cell division protein FtsW